MPGKIGGITPLVGGLLGSGAGVGIVGVTTGYVLYSNIGTITSALVIILNAPMLNLNNLALTFLSLYFQFLVFG
nr:hypothetical protein MACL_00001032 [Theileria orientalis]